MQFPEFDLPYMAIPDELTSGPILTFAPAWGGMFANVRIEGPLAKSSCWWSFWI
jgi:hypothetical protein